MSGPIRFPTLALILAAALLVVVPSKLARAQSCPRTGDVDILAVVDSERSAEVVILGAWPSCNYTHYNILWVGGGGRFQREVPVGTNRSTLPAKMRGTVYQVSIQSCRTRFLASSVCGDWKSRKFVACGTKGLPCGHPRLNAPEPVRIVSGAGRCLDVHAPDQFNDGARVQVWTCNGSNQQTWVIDEDGQSIISLAGKCLDVHAPEQTIDGAKVQVWDCNGLLQQKWRTNVRQPVGAPTRPIMSGAGKCLDVHRFDQFKDGAKVQVWACNASMQQDWRVTKL
jgi:hypothetical protein